MLYIIIYPYFFLLIYLFFSLSMILFIYLSVFLSIYLTIYPSIYLSFNISFSLSIYLSSIYLSIYLSMIFILVLLRWPFCQQHWISCLLWLISTTTSTTTTTTTISSTSTPRVTTTLYPTLMLTMETRYGSYNQWWGSGSDVKTDTYPYLWRTWFYINFHKTILSVLKRILKTDSCPYLVKYSIDALKKNISFRYF